MSKQENHLAINTSHLTRRFGTITAVDDLTLQVPSGSIFGFLGPNGAGKTTTIRLLLGLLEPSHGSAEVLGLDTRMQADAIRNQTGVLLEHNGLYERLSVADNLVFFARIWHLPAATRQARIETLLKHFNLWERRRDLVGTLSRGMKQKLAIARVLLHRPPLVFLDEPTAGLDPTVAVELRHYLVNLSQQENVTIFLTTHNLAEAEQVCDYVGIIREGQLIAAGAPKTLLATQRMPRIEVLGSGFNADVLLALKQQTDIVSVTHQEDKLELTLQADADISPLLVLMAQLGVRIEEVRRDSRNLEELFLTLMREEA